MPRVRSRQSRTDIASKKAGLPEGHVPTADELLSRVRQMPGITLRHLCGLVWPGLPWSAAQPGGDSAMARVRTWTVDDRSERATAALWLRDRMEELVAADLVRHGARRRDEVDVLAGLTYLPV